MTTPESHTRPVRFSADLLFISRDSAYDEAVSIGSRYAAGASGAENSNRITLDDLPKVGEIVVVPGSNSYWTVAGVLRHISDTHSLLSQIDELSDTWEGPLTLFAASLLLIEQTVSLDAEFPNLYVGCCLRRLADGNSPGDIPAKDRTIWQPRFCLIIWDILWNMMWSMPIALPRYSLWLSASPLSSAPETLSNGSALRLCFVIRHSLPDGGYLRPHRCIMRTPVTQAMQSIST
jgi:hypothetical protein